MPSFTVAISFSVHRPNGFLYSCSLLECGGCKLILQVSKPNVSGHRVLNYSCGLRRGVRARSSHAPTAVLIAVRITTIVPRICNSTRYAGLLIGLTSHVLL